MIDSWMMEFLASEEVLMLEMMRGSDLSLSFRKEKESSSENFPVRILKSLGLRSDSMVLRRSEESAGLIEGKFWVIWLTRD